MSVPGRGGEVWWIQLEHPYKATTAGAAVTDEDHGTKHLVGGTVYFSLQLSGPTPLLRKLGRNLRQEPTGRNWKSPWANATSQPASHGWLGLLSYATQAHLPRGGTTLSGLGPSMSINYQESAYQTCLQDTLMDAFSQFRVPSPNDPSLY